MTLPIFYAPDLADLRTGQGYVLGGAEGRHAGVVKRLGRGERLLLSDGFGLLLECTVLGPSQDGASEGLLLQVGSIRHEPECRPRLVLVQALAKDGRDELAIEAATELGVDRVVPWQADRSIVRWKPERLLKARAKWEHTLVAAAKQSRRARVPSLGPLLDTPTLIASVLAPVTSGPTDFVFGQDDAPTYTLVLHEEATQGIPEFLSALGVTGRPPGELKLLVGPEGGMSEREVNGLRQSPSVALVRLGPHVLRSSTAGPAALAVLSQLLGRWDC